MLKHHNLVGILFAIAVVAGGTELGLRLFPELVPRATLLHFQRDLRQSIAASLGFANQGQVVKIPRDDGGATLTVFKPGSSVTLGLQDTEEAGPTRLDDLGFCNPTRSVPDQVDIVTIGDSFTFCTAVPPSQTWTAKLGSITGLTAYDLGRPGIGPYEYLQILREFGLRLHPKYVVMNIYEGNDLRDAVRFQQYLAAKSTGVELFPDATDRNQPTDHPILENWLGRNSYAINLLVGAAAQLMDLVSSRDEKKTGGKIDFRYDLDFATGMVPFNAENGDKDEVRYARQLETREISPSAFTAALERFAAMGREHGFQPILTYAPSAYTAYAEYARFHDPALQDLMAGYSTTIRSFLAADATRLGVRFVDPTIGLQEIAKEQQSRSLLYFPINLHLTGAGHAAFARILADLAFSGK